METRRIRTLGLNDRRSLALASQRLAPAREAEGQAPFGAPRPAGRVHVPVCLGSRDFAALASDDLPALNAVVPKVTRYVSEGRPEGLSADVLRRLLELIRLPEGERAEALAAMADAPAPDYYQVPPELVGDMQLLNNVLTFWSTYSAYSPDDMMTLLDMGLSCRVQQAVVFPGMPLQIIHVGLLTLGNLVGDTLQTRLACFRLGVMDVYAALMRRAFCLCEYVVSDLAWALINVVRPLKDDITAGIEYLQAYPAMLQDLVAYLRSHLHEKTGYYACWGLYYVSSNPQLFELVPLETAMALCLPVIQICKDAQTPGLRLLAKEIVLHQREPQVLRPLLSTFASREMVDLLADIVITQCRLARVAAMELVRNLVPFSEPRQTVIGSKMLPTIISCCSSRCLDLAEVSLDALGGILSRCTEAEFSYVCEKKVVHILAKLLGGARWRETDPSFYNMLSKHVYYALNILEMIVEFSSDLQVSTKRELLAENLADGISEVCTSIPTVEALGEKVAGLLAARQARIKDELGLGTTGADYLYSTTTSEMDAAPEVGQGADGDGGWVDADIGI